MVYHNISPGYFFVLCIPFQDWSEQTIHQSKYFSITEYKYIQRLVLSHENGYLPVSCSSRLFVRRACHLQPGRYRSDIRLSSFLLASNALPRNDNHCTRGSENRSKRSGCVRTTQMWLVPVYHVINLNWIAPLWSMKNMMHVESYVWGIVYDPWGIWRVGNMKIIHGPIWCMTQIWCMTNMMSGDPLYILNLKYLLSMK